MSAQLAATEREILRAIVEAVRQRGTGDTGVFGLRLQRDSFDFLARKLSVLYPGQAGDHERIQAAFGNVLFIHLTRESKLEQAISLTKATQTGLWHIAPDGTELERQSAPKQPVYDARAIADQIAILGAQDMDWEDWFAQQNITPLRIGYNKLSADPQGVLALILGRIGVDKGAANGVNPGVARLADATNLRWQERFIEEHGRDADPQT